MALSLNRLRIPGIFRKSAIAPYKAASWHIYCFFNIISVWILLSNLSPLNMESNTNAVQTKIDETGWVFQIKESLDVSQEEPEELCASMFSVPRELLALKPEAFIPQTVSIGPYHHWKSELYDMERYKLTIVRRFQDRINGLGKFEAVVVEEFQKLDWQIRCCYHKFIDYKDETLAWVMALDAAFLLECLQFYVRNVDKCSYADVRPLGRILDPSGTSAAHNSVLRDVMMLENQLPLFLLQKLLELQLDSRPKAEERLENLLRLVCQELSPFTFKLPEDSKLSRNERGHERGHVLEVLYYTIVSSVFSNQNPGPNDQEEHDSPDTAGMSIVTESFNLLWKAISSLNFRPIRFVRELQRRSPNLIAFKRILSLPVKSEEKEGEGRESAVKILPPTRDELSIPSVGDLYSAGVKLVPTNGDLATIQIQFDQKTATLYLPKIKLDRNTEVILRNLVAFEASLASGATVFTRYTMLLNGMIDREEDVRRLRESGIISNHFQSDGEVASLWNSMGKCVHLTKVESLDKVIEDINTYYNGKWKVVVIKFVKEQIYTSWKILSLVAAVILLVVTCLQAFCSVYDCRKWVNQ